MKSKKALKRMRERKEEMKSNFSNNFLYLKADTTLRLRVLPVGEDEDFGMPVVNFYLGLDQQGGPKSVISPSTIDLPCALSEYFEELVEQEGRGSDMAKLLRPRTRIVIPVVKKEGLDGAEAKKVDDKMGVRLFYITTSQYQELVDWILDEELGDFSDPKDGYDIKFKREGSTMTDTTYTQRSCRQSPLPKQYAKEVNIQDLLKEEIPTYEETKKYLDMFLNKQNKEDDEDEPKSKKTSKGSKKKTIKKKRVRRLS
jgi:hypothetical protein